MYKINDYIYANTNIITYVGVLQKSFRYKILDIENTKIFTKYKIFGGPFNGEIFISKLFYTKNEIRRIKLNKLNDKIS